MFPVSLVLSLSGKERRRVIFKEIEREGMLAKQEQRSKERERWKREKLEDGGRAPL